MKLWHWLEGIHRIKLISVGITKFRPAVAENVADYDEKIMFHDKMILHLKYQMQKRLWIRADYSEYYVKRVLWQRGELEINLLRMHFHENTGINHRLLVELYYSRQITVTLCLFH